MYAVGRCVLPCTSNITSQRFRVLSMGDLKESPRVEGDELEGMLEGKVSVCWLLAMKSP